MAPKTKINKTQKKKLIKKGLVNEKTILFNLIKQEIKKNKKYSSIADRIIDNEIELYFKKNKIKLDNLDKLNKINIINKINQTIKQNNIIKKTKKTIKSDKADKSNKIRTNIYKKQLKSRKIKEIIKGVRAELHKKHSSFETKDIRKREEYLTQLNKKIGTTKEFLEIHKKILKTSLSSKERLVYYNELYKKIFEITGTPSSVSDFGCGINPISLVFMDFFINRNKNKNKLNKKNNKNTLNNKLKYFAYEISEDDVLFLNKYFGLQTIKRLVKGKAKLIDLHKDEISNKKKFPKTDVCFLFKVLDVVEKKGHKFSEYLIKKINSDYIVASFATKTLSGKPMNHPQRGWIERMLKRIGCPFGIIKFYNEIYYVINKKDRIKNKIKEKAEK